MTMEPTCAPSSLGARTTKEREAWVVPLRRRDCAKSFLSTFMMDSSTFVAARSLRKWANRETVMTRRSKADARKMIFLDSSPDGGILSMVSQLPWEKIGLRHSVWAVGFQQIGRASCRERV